MPGLLASDRVGPCPGSASRTGSSGVDDLSRSTRGTHWDRLPVAVTAGDPRTHYDEAYFRRWNYADRGLGRFSMYWFARRYYAALLRRHAPPGDARRRLLELGCGLGHLLGLLQDEFRCTGIDLIPTAVEEARRQAPRATVVVGDAGDLSSIPARSLTVVVALHLLEHLPDPRQTLVQVFKRLVPGGLLLFATPHPDYALRRLKDRATDAIGKDPTHVNCHRPPVWRAWTEEAGFVVVRHFGDGLWDVPYVPLVPRAAQLAFFGAPALVQVLTRATFMPLALGVNQIVVARAPPPSGSGGSVARPGE